MLDLDKALSIPSGLMSTRDKMLAKAGLDVAALGTADWPVGVVGVPGDGRGNGLASERQPSKDDKDVYRRERGEKKKIRIWK